MKRRSRDRTDQQYSQRQFDRADTLAGNRPPDNRELHTVRCTPRACLDQENLQPDLGVPCIQTQSLLGLAD